MAKRKKEEQSKVCYRCGKEIKPLEKYVDLITRDKGAIFSVESFHFKCWIDEFNNAVKNKLKNLQKQATEKMFNVMDMVKQTMKGMGFVDDEEETEVEYDETTEKNKV